MQTLLIGIITAAICSLIGAYFGLKGAQKIAVWYMLKRSEQNKAVINRYKNTITKKFISTMLNALPPTLQIPLSLALNSKEGQELLKYCTKNGNSSMATLEIAMHLAMRFGGQQTFNQIPPEQQQIAENIITKK